MLKVYKHQIHSPLIKHLDVKQKWDLLHSFSLYTLKQLKINGGKKNIYTKEKTITPT
uniref:Uncharacterized protein n=1 Tax=Anguilla anguilla TaxID=7936 RepID=A0A0E9WG83_ANGAN